MQRSLLTMTKLITLTIFVFFVIKTELISAQEQVDLLTVEKYSVRSVVESFANVAKRFNQIDNATDYRNYEYSGGISDQVSLGWNVDFCSSNLNLMSNLNGDYLKGQFKKLQAEVEQAATVLTANLAPLAVGIGLQELRKLQPDVFDAITNFHTTYKYKLDFAFKTCRDYQNSLLAGKEIGLKDIGDINFNNKSIFGKNQENDNPSVSLVDKVDYAKTGFDTTADQVFDKDEVAIWEHDTTAKNFSKANVPGANASGHFLTSIEKYYIENLEPQTNNSKAHKNADELKNWVEKYIGIVQCDKNRCKFVKPTTNYNSKELKSLVNEFRNSGGITEDYFVDIANSKNNVSEMQRIYNATLVDNFQGIKIFPYQHHNDHIGLFNNIAKIQAQGNSLNSIYGLWSYGIVIAQQKAKVEHSCEIIKGVLYEDEIVQEEIDRYRQPISTLLRKCNKIINLLNNKAKIAQSL